MILRSFPITDFSPFEGALIDACAPLGRAVRGSSGLGSVEELRVDMKAPQFSAWLIGFEPGPVLAPARAVRRVRGRTTATTATYGPPARHRQTIPGQVAGWGVCATDACTVRASF